MRRTGPTDVYVRKLTQMLRRAYRAQGTPLWRVAARRLCSSRRQRVAVNISRLARYSGENETVLVPGKVLGAGSLQHPLTVAALHFSEGARKIIETAGGKCLSIEELVKSNPAGSKVRLMV